jgi:predicted 2-oxoglutarate/Fe(II)-dependent dioxygenase YbiX
MGYSGIRFNRYETGTEMRLHCDHIHDMFDGERRGIPTLSIVGALNDDYKGGEFVMWEDTVIDLPTGSVLVFPSIFMYPHHVNQVTEGCRYTYVSWVW